MARRRTQNAPDPSMTLTVRRERAKTGQGFGPLFGDVEVMDPAIAPPSGRDPRRAPRQPSSHSSTVGAEYIESGGRRESVQQCIVHLLHAWGPVHIDGAGVPRGGGTVEELAIGVSQLRNKPTKETTITGRISGRKFCELGKYVTKSGHRRRAMSGVEVDVYVHRGHLSASTPPGAEGIPA